MHCVSQLEGEGEGADRSAACRAASQIQRRWKHRGGQRRRCRVPVNAMRLHRRPRPIRATPTQRDGDVGATAFAAFGSQGALEQTSPMPSCSCSREPEVPLQLAQLNAGFTKPRQARLRRARVPVRLLKLLAGRGPRATTAPACDIADSYACRAQYARAFPAELVARPSMCLDLIATLGHTFTWRGVERIASAERRELLYLPFDSAAMYTAENTTLKHLTPQSTCPVRSRADTPWFPRVPVHVHHS